MRRYVLNLFTKSLSQNRCLFAWVAMLDQAIIDYLVLDSPGMSWFEVLARAALGSFRT